jgi:WD40 repeat protein
MRRWTVLIAFGLLCIGCTRQPDPSKGPRLPEGKEAVRPGKRLVPDIGVACAAFSPDGKRIAVGFGVTRPYRGPQFKVWDVKTRKQIDYWHLPPPPPPEKKEPTKPLDREYHPVGFIAYISGGKRILTLESDNMFRIWEASEGKLVHEFSMGGPGTSGVALTADGKTLMRGTQGGFALWEVATGQMMVRREIRRNSRWRFALSPDGKRAIVQFTGRDEDRTGLVYWDLEKDKALLRLDTDSVNGEDPDELVTIPMLFSPDRRTVLATKRKGDRLGLVLCDVADLKEIRVISPMLSCREVLQGYAFWERYPVIFSPDGKKLITIDTDLKTNLRRFRCRDLTVNKELWNLEPRPRWSYVKEMLAYSPTEDLLLGFTYGRQHTLLVFMNTQDGRIVGTIPIDGLVFDVDYGL